MLDERQSLFERFVLCLPLEIPIERAVNVHLAKVAVERDLFVCVDNHSGGDKLSYSHVML